MQGGSPIQYEGEVSMQSLKRVPKNHVSHMNLTLGKRQAWRSRSLHDHNMARPARLGRAVVRVRPVSQPAGQPASQPANQPTHAGETVELAPPHRDKGEKNAPGQGQRLREGIPQRNVHGMCLEKVAHLPCLPYQDLDPAGHCTQATRG